jgi:hypothetical protein
LHGEVNAQKKGLAGSGKKGKMRRVRQVVSDKGSEGTSPIQQRSSYFSGGKTRGRKERRKANEGRRNPK